MRLRLLTITTIFVCDFWPKVVLQPLRKCPFHSPHIIPFAASCLWSPMYRGNGNSGVTPERKKPDSPTFSNEKVITARVLRFQGKICGRSNILEKSGNISSESRVSKKECLNTKGRNDCSHSHRIGGKLSKRWLHSSCCRILIFFGLWRRGKSSEIQPLKKD